MAKDLPSFLSEFEKEYPDEIVHIEKVIDSRWEATALIEKLEKMRKTPIVIFHKVKTAEGSFSEFPLVMNLFASRAHCARTIGSNFEEFSVDFARKSKTEKRKPIVVKKEDAPIKDRIFLGNDINLFKLPAPVHHGMDPGHYITGGFFTCYDRGTKTDNSALHRGWIKEKDEVRVFLSSHTHANLILGRYEEKNEDMKCAYWIGHHPAVCLGTQVKGSFPESHFEAAGG